jgi:presenilin-like A22 family membrane protease
MAKTQMQPFDSNAYLIGLIGERSMPMIMLDVGLYFLATCILRTNVRQMALEIKATAP